MDEVNQNSSKSKSSRLTNGFYIVAGWIAAVLSLIRYPFIFGVVGVIMGIIAGKNGVRAGMPLIMASIMLMALGLIFSDVFFNFLKHVTGI